jgi:2-octaprenylphenol hydroxylase
MKLDFDVLVVGAGMVGATLACALGDSRLKVGVLDNRAPVAPPRDDHDLRVSAITLASRAMLRNLGAWDAMPQARIARVEAMQVWEGGCEIEFDAADIGAPCLACIVENSVLQRALVDRLHAFSNVATLWPVEIDTLALADDAASVTLKDGRRLTARLLVGADGADSALRHAAGVESRQLDMGQKGIVATVRTQQPHANIARQHFLPAGPLAFLPLAEPNACSIVWSADNVRAETLLALDDTGFIAALEQAFGDRLGRVLSVSRRQSFPLALAHARRYSTTRLALIGDAAHTVHPLAGQGVNLGLLDAATLAETVLDAARRGRDIGAPRVLRRYERVRKGDNLGMIATTGGFKYLFGNERPLLRALRGIGLSLTHRLGPLKRAIMRRAAGIEGELPALARHNRIVP